MVVIAAIIGGILVGRDLIKGAEVQAEVSQIQKYDSATNTFKNKYNGLPGDLPNPYASQFGFAARGNNPGQGNGDGILEGWTGSAGWGWLPGSGETATFWVDLSHAGLIDQSFSTASETNAPASTVTATTTPNIAAYMPQAKIGGGNYVYVWSTSNNSGYASNYPANYYGIAAVNQILTNGKISSSPNIPVGQAAAIDKKIDDGFPLSGSVQAIMVTNDPYWIEGNDILYSSTPPSASNLSPSSTNCFDNGGNSANPTVYSTEYNGGTGLNCAISILMGGAGR